MVRVDHGPAGGGEADTILSALLPVDENPL
jgi:hypothetical protein